MERRKCIFHLINLKIYEDLRWRVRFQNKPSSQKPKQLKIVNRDKDKSRASEITESIYKNWFIKSTLANSYMLNNSNSKNFFKSSIFGNKFEKQILKNRKNIK